MSPARRVISLVLLALAALVLPACRVDVTVDLEMAEDGSGTVTLTVLADADVVEQAPGLAQELQLDDLEAAGWTTEGPSATDDGGLRIELVRPFSTPEEATAVLTSLSGPDGPFRSIGITRSEADDEVTTVLTGAARVDAGLASFADPELLAAVGSTPYADEVAEAGLSPAQALGITLRVELPGSVDETTAENEEGPPTWLVPLDGSSLDLTTTAVDTGASRRVWEVVADVALVALVAWVLLASTFIAFVVNARRQRRRRREARASRPHPTGEAGQERHVGGVGDVADASEVGRAP